MAVNGSSVKPRADTASNVPPVMVPPDISIIPSLLIVADKPASVKSESNVPIVVFPLTVIV